MRVSRRVVVARNSDGSGRIVADGPPPIVRRHRKYDAVEVADLWVSNPRPTLDGPDESVAETYGPDDVLHYQLAEIPVGTVMPLHRTPTIDVVTVLSGCIVLIEAERELTLGPEDTVVQLGSFHGWENRGDVPCRMLVASIVVRDRGAA